ncbi:hypothetical protein FOZ61_004008 [Perkinsus olseni]|uniref:Glutathione synthase substrate-binding domain-containing protein n=1 Tax=Perkinsus olseni TaxID=32597 RepID=A0A7J6LMF4_PEROL|nr:hypothetical protein FOZ61_004008 [Perkinsus olseni]
MDGPYRVRADSEQSRDVHACELVRPAVIIPELTIQGYDRTLRAVAGSEAALRDYGAMMSSLGLNGSEDGGSDVPFKTRLMPTTLLPRPFPREQFDYVYHASAVMVRLIDTAAVDSAWIGDRVSTAPSLDRRLVDTWRQVYLEGRGRYEDQIRLHLMRLDYSPGAPSGPSASLKAVHVTPELATAAQRVSEKIRFCVQCLHHMTTLTSALNKIGQCELPDNKTANEIATAMAEAVRLYNERYHRSSRDVCIVRNAKSGTAAGSGLIEAALLVNHALASHRRTVEELMRDVQVDEQSRVVRLVRPLDPARTVEVALVYYESPGYDFDGSIPKGLYGKELQSSDEAAWTVRRALEESLAVTSPSIPLQLLGQPELQLLWRGDERLRSALRFDEHSPEDLSKCLAVLQDTSSGPLVPSGMPCAAVDVDWA